MSRTTRSRQMGRCCTVVAATVGLTVGGIAQGRAAQGAPASRQAAASVRAADAALLASPKPNRPRPGVPGRSVAERPHPQPHLVSEIVADRTATSETWRGADGSVWVRRYAAPHYFRLAGSTSWLPIDTTLSKDSVGRLSSGANSWRVSFGSAAGGLERITNAGSTVTFSPERVSAPTLAPAASGSVAMYPSLWPGTDLTEQVTSTGVVEKLILTGPGAPTVFTYDVAGAAVRADSRGGLTLMAKGREFGVVPAPTVWSRASSGSSGLDVTSSSGVRLAVLV